MHAIDIFFYGIPLFFRKIIAYLIYFVRYSMFLYRLSYELNSMSKLLPPPPPQTEKLYCNVLLCNWLYFETNKCLSVASQLPFWPSNIPHDFVHISSDISLLLKLHKVLLFTIVLVEIIFSPCFVFVNFWNDHKYTPFIVKFVMSLIEKIYIP